ncbi:MULTISPECIES: ATP-binding protein [Mycobacteriaceae]|uniref:ATP-binding protein n=1 Tax=Mycolicibacterium parafortuitum TaxID=39692 RepID=A0ACC6MH17_MYCPF|nr:MULTISPECIES: ATP-binding protein [Mycobacteriaceae]MBU8830219.1 ATP-binding protein [Mycolicibacterium goodii]MDZ5086246.1 ATP-binding protein [Mycolicibacterium parafortuitum]GFM16396.1 SMC domain protein [Mycobacterium sp. PO1]GFM23156.1 SMC domain protein [Mycobacterium sp. PO2]
MIQIKAIHVEEFRGIRLLDLRLDGQSFVVAGPNGSGKSGVVDAIDFALTGSVARLSGAGTGGVSLAKHGPHVHQRDNPAAASVALTIVDSASGQTGVLTRCVKTAATYKLEPDTPELHSAVDWAAQHPELILSRREVIKYVYTEPGKRAQEVQALLKLDRIDETRRLLRTAMARSASDEKQATTEVGNAEDALRRHLDLTTLLESQVLGAVNQHRQVLGIAPLDSLQPDTDLTVGAQVAGEHSSFNKASALQDVNELSAFATDHPELDNAALDLAQALAELEDDPSILHALTHRELIEAGLPLVTEAACPLCDQPWEDAETLRLHLQGKLSRSEAAKTLERRILLAAARLKGQVQRAEALIRAAQPHALKVGRNDDQAVLVDWLADLAAFAAVLDHLTTIREQATRVGANPLALPPGLTALLAGVRQDIEALPDQSATANARSALTVAHERWTRLRQARATHIKASAAHSTAKAVYEIYNDVADTELTRLYTTVEHDFSDYYRRINADDESSFKAGLAPSAGKLDLEVDFYGLGMFPPMAYHSEGHQDGMGVCLYLALIRQLLHDDFRLAVLDDVVTSVDTNHRRQFCSLLKDVFPDVQFILTTHDEVWARQMQSSGLIGSKAHARFHGWTVDRGPVYGQGEDLWTQIDADLADDDVPGAAHKLRRNLEASMADIVAALQGKVIYRPDNNYELGALFSAAKGRHGDLLKKAGSSADKWNNQAGKQQVEDLKAARQQAMLAQDEENWAINALVHNNDWASMSKADFAPVVAACKDFLKLFKCTNSACGGWLYVSGSPGREDALRCPCGALNLNLRTK